ncbi:MAG: alanine racemase, partial [Muribaculaceae bacterium]|nr:alanine racemase [Muribaculaceae bacterium]
MSNIEDFYHELSRYGHLVTDSRSVYEPQDTVFAAIRTDIGDGHRYIADLYARGVRAFIVEERPEGFDDALFVTVSNAPEALREIARMRMADRRGGIIVTGSTGKTTVKELLYTALISRENVRRSPRSWNSGIGVPLAIWDMTAQDNGDIRHYITEVGIDAPGQGMLQAQTLGPSHDIAVITPITDEHDEAFANHDEKIREKLDIASGCRVIIYADTDPALGRLIGELRPDALAIPVDNADGAWPTIFHALAARVLAELGYTDTSDVAHLGIANKRREIAAGSFGNTVFRDYFTPDFRSLSDALDFMRRHATPTRKKALIAGRILDGGADAQARIAELAAKFGIDTIATIDTELLERIHLGDTFRDMQILLFGIPDATFSQVAEALESAGHETTLEVDLDALAHNYNYYRSLVPAGTDIVAMVKASAYGVGSIEVGKTLQSLGAAYLAVAVIEEGIALREAGITMP